MSCRCSKRPAAVALLPYRRVHEHALNCRDVGGVCHSGRLRLPRRRIEQEGCTRGNTGRRKVATLGQPLRSSILKQTAREPSVRITVSSRLAVNGMKGRDSVLHRPPTFQPMLMSLISRAVMVYACTTVHGRGSPLQTRAMPGFGFSAASSHVTVCVAPVLIST